MTVLSAAILTAADAGPAATITDPGTLGGSFKFGFGINNSGQVAGAFYTTSDNTLWSAAARQI